ncbi:DUF1800 domain-containing protein [Piscinibacter gummiphilus]|uniref:DUF1800 domain-containing protein n=1 Tax=Piscinibacter gummiphilus TaxID=946333 RepID=A0ABZ0CT44_9BURK|nr:DUF1800 domain-containing protein [Piscinibacter gummiphilus]WOB06266.1 DUF1800 domain-containing protein [Piscinibacter gummiphilus]
MNTTLPSRLSAADARHLLGRTGFMPSPGEVSAWAGLAPDEAVNRLLAGARRAEPRQPAPAFTREPIRPPLRAQGDVDARKEALRQLRADTVALAGWWLQEMRDSPTPLAERMALFWHNHFATSVQKVRQAQGMYIQHQLLRRHALGSFRELLHGVARDPAMLIYLDGAANRAESPNENFAREVMELFTLGEGQYSEQDIKEAARAFSGWAVDREAWAARFRPRQHDRGDKTLLGQRGRFDADAALDVMLDQPAAPRFIVSKLWREFVSPVPDAKVVEPVAQRFRESGWRTDVALRELLLSPAFWAPQNRAVLIKSPVELAVGTLRQFEIELDNAQALVGVTARQGQMLFSPPNVKGWPGYTDWITSTTLLDRKRFTERLFRAVEQPRMEMGRGMQPGGFGVRFDAEPWLKPLGAWPDREPDEAARGKLVEAVLATAPVHPVPAGTVGLSYLRAMSLDPAFQLK